MFESDSTKSVIVYCISHKNRYERHDDKSRLKYAALPLIPGDGYPDDAASYEGCKIAGQSEKEDCFEFVKTRGLGSELIHGNMITSFIYNCTLQKTENLKFGCIDLKIIILQFGCQSASIIFTSRGVAQLVARMVRDHEVAGSSPVAPTEKKPSHSDETASLLKRIIVLSRRKMMSDLLKCFKAYDVRGQLPVELNEDIAYRIGRGFAEFLRPERVVVGRDIRHSSLKLCAAVSDGLLAGGVDVFDIGLCGTEEIYFSTFNGGFDGGIMVTASHNPIDYNGMKFVRRGSRPVSGDDGLHVIRDLAARGVFHEVLHHGTMQKACFRDQYIAHLLNYIDIDVLKPLKIVVNAGNGCAGPVLDMLEKHLPCEFIKINHSPDGSFPNGIPNPLLPENRSATTEAVLKYGADFGIAWDGDFDRCFLFDEKGGFIEGYYIVGLLAESFLKRQPGARIIHDPRLTWNTIDIVRQGGGVPVMSKTGHAFIKARMREEDAIYGGEMSAHHYFKDFAYCDSGMIPWLLVYGLISRSGKTLGELVSERIRRFPASGEINRRVNDPEKLFLEIRRRYSQGAVSIDETDGISIEMPEWRFNLRSSNTEPVVRLNVEAKNDQILMQRCTEELLSIIDQPV